MPQVSGLSKPDIIIQIEGIEDILCVVALLMKCLSITLSGQNIYYPILMQDLATFIVPAEPFAKDQNARGGTPIYHVLQPSSSIK